MVKRSGSSPAFRFLMASCAFALIAPAIPAQADMTPAQLAKLADDADAIQGATCQIGELILAKASFGTHHAVVCIGYEGRKRVFGRVSYRYGTPGHLELDLHDVAVAEVGYAGGGEDQLIARNGDYTYVLYQATTAGDWHRDGTRGHQFQCGLIVLKAGKQLAEHPCTPPDDTIIASGVADALLPRAQAIDR